MTDAERLAKLEQTLERCLELSCHGRSEEVRQELERALGSRGEARDGHALAGVSDREIDRAFAEIEPVADEVIDADRVAQEAIREADLALERDLAGPRSSFSTRTMADLLERQGDVASASRIRADLGRRDAGAPLDGLALASASHAEAERRRRVVTLETWLENLRRGL